MKKLYLFLLIPLVLSLSGCPPLESDAYKTAVGAKAFLDSVKKAHPECTTPVSPIPRVCTLLVEATSAKDALVDAGEIYCSGGGFGPNGAACNAPKKGTAGYQIAVDKLKAAMANYKQFEKDLKGI